jgi:hypothetical protein
MLLGVLRVPLPAVMEIMGWSDPSIAKRHMHVTDELVTTIAHDVGELLRIKRPGEQLRRKLRRTRQTPAASTRGGRRFCW